MKTSDVQQLIEEQLTGQWTRFLQPQDAIAQASIPRLARAVASSVYPSEHAVIAWTFIVQEWGLRHAETQGALTKLGTWMLEASQAAPAERLYRDTLGASMQELGPAHPTTLFLMTGLAAALAAQGQLSEAEQIDRQAFQESQRALGPNHPDTLNLLSNLAADLVQQGKTEEGSALTERAAQVCRSALGLDHPVTFRSMNNFGSLLFQQGRFAEAEPVVSAVVETLWKMAGPAHPSTAHTTRLLIDILNRQGRGGEAVALYLRLGAKVVQDGCCIYIVESTLPGDPQHRVQPPETVQALFDDAVQIGLRQLAHQSEVTPVCVGVNRTGERWNVPAEELGLRLLPGPFMPLLAPLKEALPDRTTRAAALVKQVEFRSGENPDPSAALQVMIEHEDGWGVTYFLPLDKASNRVVPDEMFTATMGTPPPRTP